MRAAAFVLAALLVTAPAHAQFGGLINKAQKAKDIKDKADEMNFSSKEERQLGEKISAKLVDDFGVYQDKEVTKYVTLLGTVLAKESEHPDLNWTFIVLDTDGVNAFAAPGGIVHVTRGLLGLVKNEAELAGILGHEITHVDVKHTVRAIQKSKAVSIAGDAAGSGSLRDELIAKVAEKGYKIILDGEFSREDENEADEKGVRLANKVGYDPHGLMDVLKKLDARNSGRDERNGLFASHPATKSRIADIEKQIAKEKLSGKATVQARYASKITFDAKPVTEIAANAAGAAGLAGDDGKPAEKKDDKNAKKEEEPKKKGGLLGKVGLTSGSQSQNTQTVASAGARGVDRPDRDAKGGSNKSKVAVSVSAAELDSFKKGIA
jgi:beta-barrel assembly-enhancing protease